MNTQSKRTPLFFGLVFLFVLYLLWLMARPMLAPLIFGSILAGVFFPLNNLIKEKWKIGRRRAATITSLFIVLVVLLPLTYLAFGISKEAVGLYQSIVSGLGQTEVNDFLFGEGLAATTIKKLSASFDIQLDLELLKGKVLATVKGASGSLLASINNLIGDLFNFVFDLIIMMVVIFGLLVEGDKLKVYIFELSPLPSDQEEIILQKFNQMNYVSLVCNGIGGLIQGLLGGIALWIGGISSVLLWTVVMIFLAFIPLVGISLVTIPAGIYLALTGNVAGGIALIIYSIVVGLVVENWFKPRFIGERIEINSMFILLCIIGGMAAFGMGGIFYGPIIGILFLTFVEMYHDSYKH